jgi:hypothetical protein
MSSRGIGAAHREGEFYAEREAVQNARESEADERRGEHAAKDHDEGMDVVEHPQVAAQKDERDHDREAAQQADRGG